MGPSCFRVMPLTSEHVLPAEAEQTGGSNENDKDNSSEDNEDYKKPDKLDLIVGFLRLFNFVSCCTSVFAVVLSILYPLSKAESKLGLWCVLDKQNNCLFFHIFTKCITLKSI